MTAFPPVPVVSGVAAPLLRANVDTDAIIPSREIRGVGKTGLADGLFAGWRYRPGTREPDPAFVLNDPVYAGAAILLGGDNFGCGSSREHAVWALHEYGFRAVIAPSFAPIFASNCVRNGVVPVVLARDDIARLGREVRVDLGAMSVTSGDALFAFTLDPEARVMLIEGLDAIDLTMKNAAAIWGWTEGDRDKRPWVYPTPSPSGERDRPRSGQGEGPFRRQTPQHLLQRSRDMRADPTEAEAKLWHRLRGRRLHGHKFRRQVPIGSYIADFVSPEARLIVELDGSQHVDQQSYDDRRTAFLQRQGYRVLRVWNNDALGRTEDVLEAILHALTFPPLAASQPVPSPKGGGDAASPSRERSTRRGRAGEGL